MAAFDFPNSPSVNDQHTDNGITFKWDGTVWKRVSATGAQGPTGSTGAQGATGPTGAQGQTGAQAYISDSAPSSGITNGDLWWDSDSGDFSIYYDDGSSAEWIEVGSTGPTGPTGAQGATGTTGAQGASGGTGAQGAAGSSGSAGAQGAVGATGAQGASGSATISNNADDRVITGGSGSNLNGESGLTYDGTQLTIQKTGNGSLVEPLMLRNTGTGANTDVGIKFYNNGAGTIARIKAYDAGTYNGGLIFEYAPTAGSLNNNTSESFRINHEGKVMINTTNSSSRTLNLNGTFGILSTNQSGVIDMSVSDAGVAVIAPYVSGGSSLQLKTNASGSGVATRLTITSGGQVNIGGDYTQTSRSLAVTGSVLFKSTEADVWLESTGPNGVWRILGSTGGNTHQFRIYDNTNAADRLIIDSSGRVVIGDTSTTNASVNADNLVISQSGQAGMTIVSTNSSYSNIYFSDGSGSGAAGYAGYVQYNHGNNHLNIGAGAAARLMIYDKAGGSSHAVLQVGGSTSNNHYNSYSNASITFGGGNDIENYFIGTRMENYGGNYTKLDLRWHTGIRMGAQQSYGGIRFYDNEDLGTVKFSIMNGGDHCAAHTTFIPFVDNTYNLGSSSQRWANIYSADLQLSNIGTGGNEVDGTEGSWTLQEAEDTVYMINRISGKRYKIKMEEV